MVSCIFYGPGIHKEWFENAAVCHIQIAGNIAEMITPADLHMLLFGLIYLWNKVYLITDCMLIKIK